MQPERSIISTSLRIITFRASGTEMASLGWRHLAFGLIATWIVGMGRYWDDPGAHLLQKLGVGSVVYIFALSMLLFLIIAPLGPKNWSYVKVLAFVSLTSPPAILYAIPVERFMTVDAAASTNALFLFIVATWRVALLMTFLSRTAQLSLGSVVVATFLPLTLVVSALTFLNLERATFEIMGGLRETTAADGAYAVLVLLTSASVCLFFPLLAAYLGFVASSRIAKRKEIEADTN